VLDSQQITKLVHTKITYPFDCVMMNNIPRLVYIWCRFLTTL